MTKRWSANAALVTTLVLAGALFTGCPGDDDADGGVTVMDGGTSNISCSENVPTTTGTEVGRGFRNFTLTACDGSSYSFYNEDFCEAEYTLVIASAGWCGPCIRETQVLEEDLTAIYAERGVRVIQVLIQKADYSAPDTDYCQTWRDTYDLDQTIELIDPAQQTGIYFPAGSLPSSLIVDSEGTIVWRGYGASSTGSAVSHITAELDALLEG